MQICYIVFGSCIAQFQFSPDIYLLQKTGFLLSIEDPSQIKKENNTVGGAEWNIYRKICYTS